MARLLPDRDGRRREIGVSEVANGNGDEFGKTRVLPVNGGSTRRTEMEGQAVTAFGCPRPHRRLTLRRNLFTAEARLVADYGTSAPLACKTTTHGDARGFALDCKFKLSAAAGRVSAVHSRAP